MKYTGKMHLNFCLMSSKLVLQVTSDMNDNERHYTMITPLINHLKKTIKKCNK